MEESEAHGRMPRQTRGDDRRAGSLYESIMIILLYESEHSDLICAAVRVHACRSFGDARCYGGLEKDYDVG